jgi:antitoxin component HigA of HigAB toxin-antitoxin module
MLAKALPKRIENDAEFDRFAETMEVLSRVIERGEGGMRDKRFIPFLPLLFREYDERGELLPAGNALQTFQFLMERRALRLVDLPRFSARSITSLLLSGKRKLSKTHIRKLAETHE